MKVIQADYVEYKSGREAVLLTLKNEKLDKMRFRLLVEDTDLINHLLTITYGNTEVHEADVQDFVGLEFLVWLEIINGYLNITGIGLPEHEADI